MAGPGTSAEEFPEVPKLRVDKLIPLARKLDRIAREGLTGRELTVEDLLRFQVQVGQLIKGGASALSPTLSQLEGRKLSPGQAGRLGWQIAGRHQDWGGGRPILIHDVPVASGWVPLEVTRTREDSWPDGRRAAALDLFCLAGSPAGFLVQKKVPEAWLRFLAYRIGYGRRNEYPEDPSYLVGFRFWAFLTTSEEGLDLNSWGMDDRLRVHNRAILKLRHRYELDLECPFGLEHECRECTRSCNDCPASPNRLLG